MSCAKDKEFYSCPDTASVREVPQPLQHQANAARAEQLGGKIAFYIMEEWYTLDTQELLRQKLRETPKVSGFIFFRLSQFFYGGHVNLSLMRSILSAGYELHFARERIAITGPDAFAPLLPLISYCSKIQERDRSSVFFSELQRTLNPSGPLT